MNLIAAAFIVTMSLEAPITQITTEEMCIFSSNRMILMEGRYPDKYKTKSAIEVLLQERESGERE